MINEEVIIHREYIQKLGEQKYFQIALPVDTKKIIGIETGTFRYSSGATQSGFIAYFGGNPIIEPPDDPLDPPFKIGCNDVIGRLSLQTQEYPGAFFQSEVRQKDKNWKWADFTPELNPAVFDQYSHDRKRYEANVKVDICTPTIEGHYKDSWAAHYNYHIVYDLLIYIWIEKVSTK